MNSDQQGQGSDKSTSMGQDGSQGAGQQSQSGSQGQQGGQGAQQGKDNSLSREADQQSQSGGAGGQQGSREADQRKDFDKLMSESDQQLRDSTMQQGSGGTSGGGKQSR